MKKQGLICYMGPARRYTRGDSRYTQRDSWYNTPAVPVIIATNAIQIFERWSRIQRKFPAVFSGGNSFLVVVFMYDDDESLIACRPEHGRWQEAATNERPSLARLLNTCFYLDSRPELRNTEVTHIPR